MKLARTLDRLRAYQKAAVAAEDVKSVIRSHFPEALFDPLRPVVGGNGSWALGVYTRDDDGWVVLNVVDPTLRRLLVQRQVQIAVVPLPLHHFLDEDIAY